MSKLSKLLLLSGIAGSSILFYCLWRKERPTEDKEVSNPEKKHIPLGSCIIKDLNRKEITGMLNFNDVVTWFKNIPGLNQNIDIPFIAKAEDFKEMLGTLPSKPFGVFIGVYNEASEYITHHLYIEADELDEQTKEVMGKESLVVLQ